MEHKGTVQIETEHLTLRKFTMGDTEAAFRNWESDDKVTEFLRWRAMHDIFEVEHVMREWVDGYAAPSFYQWAIVLKDINEPIGTISVVGMDERTIPFFFEDVKVKRIEAQHDPDNPASGKVMRKCGLIYEGTLRKADWSNRGIVDACMYSLLADDYFNK